MHNFTFHSPLSVDEAVNRLGVAPEGVPLAGGMTLIPTLKQRLAAPTDFVDLSRALPNCKASAKKAAPW